MIELETVFWTAYIMMVIARDIKDIFPIWLEMSLGRKSYIYRNDNLKFILTSFLCNRYWRFDVYTAIGLSVAVRMFQFTTPASIIDIRPRPGLLIQYEYNWLVQFDFPLGQPDSDGMLSMDAVWQRTRLGQSSILVVPQFFLLQFILRFPLFCLCTRVMTRTERYNRLYTARQT